jgi:hypothetical protein
MHSLSLGFTGAMGLFIGLDILVRIPSLWGYSAIVSGLFLFMLGVIREASPNAR